MEHCPALPARVNEIQFQKPKGKKMTLTFAAPYLVDWNKLQRAVLKLLSELLHSSSLSSLTEAIVCVPFKSLQKDMKYHSHFNFMEVCLLSLT